MAQQGLDQLGLHGSLLGARAAVTPVRALVSRALSPKLQHRQLGWCLIGQEPVWNGVDLSPCVRLGLLNGLLPAIFIGVSVLAATAALIVYLWTHRSGAVALSTDDDSPTHHSVITAAENDLIYQAANEAAGLTHLSSPPDLTTPAPLKHASSADLGRALLRSKKDALNVVGSASVGILIALNTLDAQPHSNWTAVLLGAWLWALALSIAKFTIGLHAQLRHQVGGAPVVPSFWYTQLEFHLIPWFMLYTTLGFFNLRSALITYYAGHATDASRTALAFEAAIYCVSLLVTATELLAPRPTAEHISPDLARPAPLQRRASLLSKWLFAFVDPYLWHTAFPKPGQPPQSLATFPELAASHQAAPTLAAFRRNAPGFAPGTSMAWRLAHEFRHELLEQQFWAWTRVATVALPSLLLKGILGHVATRYAGGDSPTHVAFLFAFLMAVLSVAASVGESQGRILGMNIATKMKAIVTAELLMKALRRKDISGTHKAAGDDQANTAGPSPSTPGTLSEDGTLVDVAEAGQDTPDGPKPAVVEAAAAAVPQEGDNDDGASGGKILQMVANDLNNVAEACSYIHLVFPEMLGTIGVAVGLLFFVLGWSAVAGVAVLLMMGPISTYTSKGFFKWHVKLKAAADSRLDLVTEIIRNIKIVKLNAWEEPFDKLVDHARARELDFLWKRAVTVMEQSATTFGSPIIVAVATFVVHTKVLHQPLPAETAFTALALFNILRGPLARFTNTLSYLLQARVGLLRVDAFLAEPDTDKFEILNTGQTGQHPIVGFYEGAFAFGKKEQAVANPDAFKLTDLSLRFPVGKLSLITGPVGSGKSAMLASLLGETTRLSGTAFLPSPASRPANNPPSVPTESTAYCAQAPFLVSASIKDNILFGSAFDQARFDKVLFACALDIDLKQFDAGAETEVGESGTVLSGGQKARLSLARAIYSSAKYVLLDDILSAVDSHTSQHLLEHCLTGPLMKGRTCVLVTHAVDLCTKKADYIVVLNEGKVVSATSPDKLTEEALATLDEVRHEEHPDDATEPVPAAGYEAAEEAEKPASPATSPEHAKLIQEETQKTGAVSFATYKLYFDAAGGWPMGLALFAVFGAAQLAEVVVSLTLRSWATSYDQPAPAALQTIHTTLSSDQMRTPDFWLGVYCFTAAVNLVLNAARVAYILKKGIIAAKTIYSRLMHALYHAPMRFYDSTPSGRIQNRLSKDTMNSDQEVAFSFLFLFIELWGAAGILITISAVLPQFLLVAVVLSPLYYLIGTLYVTSARELRRTESTTRSPIFSLFGESMAGVATIRAYSDSARFTRKVFALIDTNNRPFYVMQQVSQWLTLRINMAGAVVTFAATSFVLSASGSIDAGMAGFVLSFAIALSERMMWVVALYGYLELEMASLERIEEYLHLPQERQGGVVPPAVWPSRSGSIEVEGLTVAYAPGLPSVLKNVSFKIGPGEKVGVVGRTGSGKSSLALSFYRIMEASSGRIVIDGIDTSTLSLNELRSRLTIVAQEPALFAGTLRFNLDPFETHTDEELWDALRRVGLAGTRSGLPTPARTPAPTRPPSPTLGAGLAVNATEDGEEKATISSLSMVLLEGGKNLSTGQRQLVALARGLLKLKTSPILLLDESTASLDHASDERIQQTIRDDMGDATIICIAHRLRTVANFDKILVLGAGEVVEFGAPWGLLKEEGSAFAGLCRRSGEFDDLVRLAEEAKRAKK